MSRRVQIVLLCEDQQQQAFARRFLQRTGWDTRSLRVEMAPKGEGSAEKYVRTRFPRELVEHRRRSVSRALIVMMDGDDRGVQRRVDELDAECRSQGCPVRTSDEAVLVFIPTWNIESWISYLGGQSVDEAKDDYPRLPRARECGRQVQVLVDMCRQHRLREPAPPSLAAACTEYGRWSDAL